MDQGSGVRWMRKEVFVGLDYATAFVQVCVLDELGQVLAKGRCENHWAELDAFVRRFAATPRAALEACPGAANLADELVAHANGSIDLAHPGYVQRMKPSPDKTDFTAARMLAGLVRVGYLPRVWLAPETVRALRRLVRRRQALVERRRALKLQVSGWLREVRVRSPEGRRWTQRWQAWLKTVPLPSETRWVIDDVCVELAAVQRHVARVERRLAQVARRDVMVQRMRGAPGIGLITACVLRAEIGDATRFRTGKQLSPFCGRTPRNASSGLRQADAGLIRAGNRYLRATRREAAHRLKRLDPRWRQFAAELEKRGKKHGVIVAAIANRWVRGLFHELVELSRAA
jgi:transposase